jgi:NAD(P)-dependent dehydrogenase (short-subunit alcohol dehydrogenase family)
MADRPAALIVGANRGIGLGVVEELLERGWDVIATARRPDNADELGALAGAKPGQLAIQPLDMADAGSIDAFADRLKGRALDLALVNAGVAGPAHRSADRVSPEEIGALMFVNAIAPVRLARHLIEVLRPGRGVLGFTSSVMGSVALNGGGHELYRASKAALNSLTRGLQSEARGRRLTLLTLHPGWVRTDMGGPGAAVSVEDSARGLADVMERAAGQGGHRFLDYQGESIAW